MAKRDREDSSPKPLEDLSWEEGDRVKSLRVIYERIWGEACRAKTWYQKAVPAKKRWAVTLRFGAVIFGSGAGIIPLLAQLHIAGRLGLDIQPVWASISLAVAAALVALDRFFGYSSAWMRYRQSEFHLDQVIEEFEMDWEVEKAGWENPIPSTGEVRSILQVAKAFLAKVKEIVRNETNAWVDEFAGVLKRLDERLELKRKEEKPKETNPS